MNKWNVLKAYIQARYRKPFRSKEEIVTYQNKMLQHFFRQLPDDLAYFKQMTPEQKNQLHIHTLKQLPIIEKTQLMNGFDDMNTIGITKEEAFEIARQAEETRDFSPTYKGVTIGLSSGTSGNRGIFLVSPSEREKWAGIMLGKMLPQSIMRKQKVAFFLRANSNLYETVANSRIEFTFFDLLTSVEENIQKLKELSPDILVAPPSMLRMIAEKGPFHSFEKVISVAEVLEARDKQYLEQVFQQTIHQVYQCTEGFLGFTCREGNLHLNEEFVYIEKEYIDEEKGIFHPIITDFSRFTQPIIRYRLNDLLVESKAPCPCGNATTVLERIDGRSDDIFTFKQKERKEDCLIFPDFIRRAVIMHGDTDDQFRVIQEADLSLSIYLTNIADGENVIQSLQSLLAKQGCEQVEMHVYPYEHTKLSTKLRRVFKR